MDVPGEPQSQCFLGFNNKLGDAGLLLAFVGCAQLLRKQTRKQREWLPEGEGATVNYTYVAGKSQCLTLPQSSKGTAPIECPLTQAPKRGLRPNPKIKTTNLMLGLLLCSVHCSCG